MPHGLGNRFKHMSTPIHDPAGNHQHQNNSQSAPPPRTPVFDALYSAVRRGAEQARKEAEAAFPKIKSAAADAAYWTAYGASFAAVFQWTVVKHLTPQPVKSGLRDGIKTGREAAENWVAEMKRRNTAPPVLLTAPPAEPGSVNPGVV
jgi:hypothetical protein